MEPFLSFIKCRHYAIFFYSSFFKEIKCFEYNRAPFPFSLLCVSMTFKLYIMNIFVISKKKKIRANLKINHRHGQTQRGMSFNGWSVVVFPKSFFASLWARGDLAHCLSSHGCLATVWRAGTEETPCQFRCWWVGKPHVPIYPCQPQALLTIFNESPLLLLLPSAMTFTI